MRRRGGDHVVVVREEDDALHVYPLIEVQRRQYVDPLVRLEEARCEVFSALAPIVGADALADLLADLDAALADLKRERDQ